MALEPVELAPEKVTLATPVIIPAKIITDVRVNFVTYTYQKLDGEGKVLYTEHVLITAEALAAKLPLLAELNKDAEADAAKV